MTKPLITEADIDELRKLGVQKEREAQEMLRLAKLLLDAAEYLDTIRAECRTLGKEYKAAMDRSDRAVEVLQSRDDLDGWPGIVEAAIVILTEASDE